MIIEKLLRACLDEDNWFAGMAPWYIFDELIMPNEQRGEVNGKHENYNEIREAITDGVDGEQGAGENSETVVPTVSLLTTMTTTTTTAGARVVTTVTCI